MQSKKLIFTLGIAFILTACESETPTSGTDVTQTTTPPVQEAYEFEVIPEGESEQIADIASKTIQLQNMRADNLPNQNGQKLRGVHPKSHGCIIGELQINADLDSDMQVGLLSSPGSQYKTLIRYSNASVRLSPDLEGGKNGSRGMAMKIYDVNGDVLVSDNGASNQDFLMINTAGFAFPNVRSYQRLTDALVTTPPGVDPSAAFAETPDFTDEDQANLEKTFKMLGVIGSKTVRNPVEVQYFAAAPSAFGDDRVMKFSVAPCDGEKQQTPFTEAEAADVSLDYLHEALAETMRQNDPVCLDLKMQVADVEQVKTDRASNPGSDIIEDATRVWDEQQYPFVSVGKITVETPQDIVLTATDQEDCKASAFNPWHSLKAHQPLGGINRLRKPVYLNSASNRP